jgi:hypothetical protein
MINRDNHQMELTGLELAKYILLRLVDNRESIEQLSKDFDNDVRFIERIVKFLNDVKWVELDRDGSYQMTDLIKLKVSTSKIVV